MLTEILRHGRVCRAFIGIGAQTLPISRRMARPLGIDSGLAAMVTTVEPDGPSAKGGLRVRDIIVGLDGVPVTGADDLIRLLGGERIGRVTEIAIVSAGRLRSVSVTPIERDRR